MEKQIVELRKFKKTMTIEEQIDSEIQFEKSELKRNTKYTNDCFKKNIDFLQKEFEKVKKSAGKYGKDLKIDIPKEPNYRLEISISYLGKSKRFTAFCDATFSNDPIYNRIGLIDYYWWYDYAGFRNLDNLDFLPILVKNLIK